MEFGVLLESDGFFVCRAGLVVEDLEVNQKTPGCQACHNDIVGCNAMAVAHPLKDKSRIWQNLLYRVIDK